VFILSEITEKESTEKVSQYIAATLLDSGSTSKPNSLFFFARVNTNYIKQKNYS
jgi:hypothetical protein